MEMRHLCYQLGLKPKSQDEKGADDLENTAALWSGQVVLQVSLERWTQTGHDSVRGLKVGKASTSEPGGGVTPFSTPRPSQQLNPTSIY